MMPSELESRSPAKVNLFLAVTGKRADGYHDLVSLMACVDLYDHIHFHFEGSDISIRCNARGVPEDTSNLACRAALRFRSALIRKTSGASFGLRMEIIKRIPVGAGLGGGSSNAATVLKVLNRYFGHPLSPDELTALALPLGADVPYFLYGRPAIVSGIGEKIQPYRGLRPLSILIVFPGGGLSTAEVYGALNLRLTNCEKKLKGFLLKKEAFKVGAHLCNDLESSAIQRCPDILSIKTELLGHGADGACMSGSGSSVVGLFKSPEATLKARETLAARNHWQFFQGVLLV
ncbi:MAG: 4-(cytidine 5'-diphospho)-2-C-methyl-D-erythritol kinase [Desulfosarcina sp.]|nr:4-(cytidine 5'-diphospho)-2-C-methyl-D-erythritol kinase [Desulfobacterales bacterium]